MAFLLLLCIAGLARSEVVVGSQSVGARIPHVHSTSSVLRDDGHEHGLPAGSSLMCNCTFPASLHCSFDGLCDATHVALHLRNEIRTVRQTMDAIRLNPQDSKALEWRDRACRRLASGQDVADLLLLEYENWEPACLRFESGLTSCGLGPRGSRATRRSDGYTSLPDPDAAIARLARVLQCPEDRVVDKVSVVYACSSEYCNQFPALSLPELSVASPPLWLYAGVPAAVLALILIAMIVLYCVYRSTLWKHVLRVSDRSKELKSYEDVDISGTETDVQQKTKPPFVV